MKIKVGDRVRTIPFHKKERPKYGKVMSVTPHDPKDPVASHGFVAVKFDDGDEEHYAESRWERWLTVLRS